MRLPEDRDAAAALDAAIRKEPTAVVDAVGSFFRRAAGIGISTLPGVGLPLRPVVLSRARLAAIAGDCVALAARARDTLLARHAAGADLFEELGVPRPFYEATDFAASLRSPWSLATMRPDGFLLDDAFHVTELNAVNGVLLSTAYAAAIDMLVRDHLPILDAAGLPKEGLVRPFDGLVRVLKEAAGNERPTVALLLPGPDCFGSEDWGERVHQQLQWAPRLLADAGCEVVVVDEHGLDTDARGVAREAATGRAVDVVFLATTGLGFFDSPERLDARDGDLKLFRGPTIGRAPFVLPIATLAMEKGMLPTLASAAPPSSAVQVRPTEYPTRARLPTYRLQKDRFVLKRSFKDKHTFVGVAEHGRRWNAHLDMVFAGGEKDYVLQEYLPMPTTTLPVLIDGARIEWIEVRVEVSPFIFAGAPWGAMVRYAPDREGLVMSPPPPDMGFGVAYLV